MADTAGGNPGMNKLARVLQQRMKEILEYRIGGCRVGLWNHRERWKPDNKYVPYSNSKR